MANRASSNCLTAASTSHVICTRKLCEPPRYWIPYCQTALSSYRRLCPISVQPCSPAPGSGTVSITKKELERRVKVLHTFSPLHTLTGEWSWHDCLIVFVRKSQQNAQSKCQIPPNFVSSWIPFLHTFLLMFHDPTICVPLIQNLIPTSTLKPSLKLSSVSSFFKTVPTPKV